MKLKILLLAFTLVLTQMSIGQFSRSDSGLKTNVTKPYEWKANMDESLLFNSLEENFDGFSDFTLNFSPWT